MKTLTSVELEQLKRHICSVSVKRSEREKDAPLLQAGHLSFREQLQEFIRTTWKILPCADHIRRKGMKEASIVGGSLDGVIAEFCMQVRKFLFYDRTEVVHTTEAGESVVLPLVNNAGRYACFFRIFPTPISSIQLLHHPSAAAQS